MLRNQVFNNSTKYLCDRIKKWKMAVMKKWCRNFGSIGCQKAKANLSYWVETEFLF